MTGEKAIIAAILGELIPELKYAAPRLLERFDRGDALIHATPPKDVGFEGGAVDSVLLECFKALVPYVQMVLGWGVIGAFNIWQASKRDSRHHAELVALLTAQLDQSVKMQQGVAGLSRTVSRMDKEPFSTMQVVESIAAALERVGRPEDSRSRM
ncbi:MAG TPA: hypothetical protein VF618_12390 [Thermoanaerobaculia bacterium]